MNKQEAKNVLTRLLSSLQMKVNREMAELKAEAAAGFEAALQAQIDTLDWKEYLRVGKKTYGQEFDLNIIFNDKFGALTDALGSKFSVQTENLHICVGTFDKSIRVPLNRVHAYRMFIADLVDLELRLALGASADALALIRNMSLRLESL